MDETSGEVRSGDVRSGDGSVTDVEGTSLAVINRAPTPASEENHSRLPPPQDQDLPNEPPHSGRHVYGETEFWAGMASLGPWLHDLGAPTAERVLAVLVERRRRLQEQVDDTSRQINKLDEMTRWLQAEMQRGVLRQGSASNLDTGDRRRRREQQQRRHQGHQAPAQQEQRAADARRNSPNLLPQLNRHSEAANMRTQPPQATQPAENRIDIHAWFRAPEVTDAPFRAEMPAQHGAAGRGDDARFRAEAPAPLFAYQHRRERLGNGGQAALRGAALANIDNNHDNAVRTGRASDDNEDGQEGDASVGGDASNSSVAENAAPAQRAAQTSLWDLLGLL